MIRNAGDVAPKGDFVFRAATVDVQVLPPVDTSGWRIADLNEHVREVRNMFARALGQAEETTTAAGTAARKSRTEGKQKSQGCNQTQDNAEGQYKNQSQKVQRSQSCGKTPRQYQAQSQSRKTETQVLIEMELADKFREGNPWPVRDGQRVLFILDSRNGFERDLLRQWIHHHRASGSEEFEAPQVCLQLGDDRKTIDTSQLIVALALPADTLVAPLRVAWLPSQEDIDSGPRLRNLFFGDPRHPGAGRGRRIFNESPARMRLIAGSPDSVANLRERFELHHSIEQDNAQRDFAEFVAPPGGAGAGHRGTTPAGGTLQGTAPGCRQPEVQPRLQRGRGAARRGKRHTQGALMKEATGYMDEMVSQAQYVLAGRLRQVQQVLPGPGL